MSIETITFRSGELKITMVWDFHRKPFTGRSGARSYHYFHHYSGRSSREAAKEGLPASCLNFIICVDKEDAFVKAAKFLWKSDPDLPPVLVFGYYPRSAEEPGYYVGFHHRLAPKMVEVFRE